LVCQSHKSVPAASSGDRTLTAAATIVVRHGTAQHSTAQHSTAKRSMAQNGTERHGTARHSTAQHGTARHSTARHSTAQHSTAQHSTAQHNPAACHMYAPARAVLLKAHQGEFCLSTCAVATSPNSQGSHLSPAPYQWPRQDLLLAVREQPLTLKLTPCLPALCQWVGPQLHLMPQFG